MVKVRKKTAIVEAMQFTKENWSEVSRWVNDTDEWTWRSTLVPMGAGPGTSFVCKGFTIKEGRSGHLGDWIVKDENGNVQSFSADNFAALYEITT